MWEAHRRHSWMKLLLERYKWYKTHVMTECSERDEPLSHGVQQHYTTFTNLSIKYLVMCKVYTDVGGIK